MSSMEELRQRIGVINGRIGQINDQRNKNIGMRESLTAQLNQNIADYQAKYGVDLSSAELVEAEYNRVSEEIGEGIALLENVVSKIETGDYSGANALLGVEPKEQVTQSVQNEQPVAQPVAQSVQTEQPVAQSVAQPAAPVQNEQTVVPTQVAQPTAPVAPQFTTPVATQPAAPQPITPVTSEPVASPTAPSMLSMTPPPVPPAPSTESFLSGFEKPATPTGVTPPVPSAPVQNSTEAAAPVNPMSFGGILGGTQFEA